MIMQPAGCGKAFGATLVALRCLDARFLLIYLRTPVEARVILPPFLTACGVFYPLPCLTNVHVPLFCRRVFSKPPPPSPALA